MQMYIKIKYLYIINRLVDPHESYFKFFQYYIPALSRFLLSIHMKIIKSIGDELTAQRVKLNLYLQLA